MIITLRRVASCRWNNDETAPSEIQAKHHVAHVKLPECETSCVFGVYYKPKMVSSTISDSGSESTRLCDTIDTTRHISEVQQTAPLSSSPLRSEPIWPNSRSSSVSNSTTVARRFDRFESSQTLPSSGTIAPASNYGPRYGEGQYTSTSALQPYSQSSRDPHSHAPTTLISGGSSGASLSHSNSQVKELDAIQADPSAECGSLPAPSAGLQDVPLSDLETGGRSLMAPPNVTDPNNNNQDGGPSVTLERGISQLQMQISDFQRWLDEMAQDDTTMQESNDPDVLTSSPVNVNNNAFQFGQASPSAESIASQFDLDVNTPQASTSSPSTTNAGCESDPDATMSCL